jgi:hypothetical protein
MFALAAAFAVSPVSSVLAETVTTKTTTVREPTGRLVITDAQTRSFRLGSESKVYVAPPSIDLDTLSGQDVKIYLEDDGRVSRITRSTTVRTD